MSGRVVDATGRGVAGVTVSLSGRGEMPDLGGEGEIMLEMPGSDGRYRAVTDGTGQFVINDVPEGRYRARLRGTGWRQVSGPTELDIKAGHQTTAPADFVVSATAALVARFADGAGAAISGGATVVFRDSSGRSIRRMHGTLGADGTLTLNDPPVGTFDVEITVWGYKPTTIQAAIQEGLPTDVGLQTLTPDDGKGGAIFLPGDEDD
ncbi:MAG: carboxypeptidase regulatory-like domain-containing protein [Planctomycetes bacterium]|nr:carboxypeptidase regulatory-like domain-containing protein [Planctomycetota bacterium]